MLNKRHELVISNENSAHLTTEPIRRRPPVRLNVLCDATGALMYN